MTWEQICYTLLDSNLALFSILTDMCHWALRRFVDRHCKRFEQISLCPSLSFFFFSFFFVLFKDLVNFIHLDCLFRDGPRETARKLGVFTDGESNESPSSTSNQVLIRFRSNTEKGGLFRINYQGMTISTTSVCVPWFMTRPYMFCMYFQWLWSLSTQRTGCSSVCLPPSFPMQRSWWRAKSLKSVGGKPNASGEPGYLQTYKHTQWTLSAFLSLIIKYWFHSAPVQWNEIGICQLNN